jgi:glycogen(starch) synthase
MRILFLSSEYPPETGFGGIGSSVKTHARALAERGHDVHVLSWVAHQPSSDYDDGPVRVHRRGHLSIRGAARLLRMPQTHSRLNCALACAREARALGPFDIVEAPDWHAEGAALALRRTLPVVVTLHSPLHLTEAAAGRQPTRDTRVSDLLERFAASRADAVIAPSQLIGRRLEPWLRGRSPILCRNAVDTATAPRVGATRPLVLAAGRVEAQKGADVLVEAAALLVQDVPDLEVVFVGRSGGTLDGLPFLTALEKRAQRFGAPCRFIGEVPASELAGWRAQARVGAVSSRHDNFPMTGLEAMADGLPVVVTTSTGLAEVVGNTSAGTVVPPEDPRALAEALKRYLLDPELALAAGAAAREVVGAHCAPQRIAAARESIYERVLAQRSRSSAPSPLAMETRA